MKQLNINEEVKSSEFTGSNEPVVIGAGKPLSITEEDVLLEKDKIVQLSNDSIMHGYDLAIEIVAGHSNTEAVKVLAESRAAIEVGLHKSKAERINGNFEATQDSTRKEDNSSE